MVRVSGGWDIILAVKDCLTAYLDGREAQFDPATEQGRLLHGAIVGESMDGANCYVVLLACEDRSGAMTAFYPYHRAVQGQSRQCATGGRGRLDWP